MKTQARLIVMLVALLGLGLAAHAEVSVQFGVSVDDDHQNFYLALGDYYKVPASDVVAVREQSLPDDEMPAAFFVAQRAGIAPSEVIALRLRHTPWRDICVHFNLAPNIFYVPGQSPFGYARLRNARRWRSVALSDNEVVDFCNQRFFVEHYGYSAAEVARQRRQGLSYVAIHHQAYEHRSPEHRDVRAWESRGGSQMARPQVGQVQRQRVHTVRPTAWRNRGPVEERGNQPAQPGQAQPQVQSGNQGLSPWKSQGHGNGRGHGNGVGKGEYESNGHGRTEGE